MPGIKRKDGFRLIQAGRNPQGAVCGREDVDPKILDPRDTYADPKQWYEKAEDLAARFIKNFKKYENNAAGKALVAAGPHLDK